MTPILRFAVAASTLAAATFGPANVRILYYSASASYVQTGDSAIASQNFSGQVSVFLNASTDATAGTLSLPNGATVGNNVSGPELIGFVSSTPDAALFGQRFAGGTYTVAFSAGAIAPASGSFAVPTGLVPDAVPSLTGDSFTRLQDTRADRAITLTTNGFAAFGAGSVTNFSISDLSTGASTAIGGYIGSTASEITIPAGFLKADQEYSFFLNYYNPTSVPLNGFGSGLVADLSGSATTRGTFRTSAVPEPTSVAAIVLGVLALARRRTRRS